MVVITDKGLEATARFIAGVSPLASFQYIGLGQNIGPTAEDPSNLKLDSEMGASGAVRSAAVCEFIPPATIKWSRTFTFTGARLVGEIGVFNDPNTGSGGGVVGDMFLRHVLSPGINYGAGDVIEFILIHKWTV